MSRPSRPPAVSRVLETECGKALVAQHGHDATVEAMRSALADIRRSGAHRSPEDVAKAAGAVLTREARSRVRAVWNLTGTILHTNLGRAVLSEGAIAAAVVAMRRPVALEYDLGSGARGDRDDLVADLLCALCGAEAATVVNNNAAAVMLTLDTFGRGGEVIVSRGELIEIGGAFRLPDIMERTGARLREVGTTNRTHLRDYEEAIGPDTRMILKVHPSNFKIEGFTASVSAPALAELARSAGVPLAHDLGSGTLADVARYGLPREPTVREAVAEGADIVTFSGDKLLGGPQAGFAVGRAEFIAKLKRNPLKRALRMDKIRLAAVEATLREHRAEIATPTFRAIAREAAEIMQAAERLAPLVRARLEGVAVEIVESASVVGSGATPTATLPSAALALTPEDGRSLEALADFLRALPEPVIGRIRDGALLLDLRCLEREAEPAFLSNLSGLSAGDETL